MGLHLYRLFKYLIFVRDFFFVKHTLNAIYIDQNEVRACIVIFVNSACKYTDPWAGHLRSSHLVFGTSVLARQESDGFFYLGKIKQEVEWNFSFIIYVDVGIIFTNFATFSAWLFTCHCYLSIRDKYYLLKFFVCHGYVTSYILC